MRKVLLCICCLLLFSAEGYAQSKAGKSTWRAPGHIYGPNYYGNDPILGPSLPVGPPNSGWRHPLGPLPGPARQQRLQPLGPVQAPGGYYGRFAPLPMLPSRDGFAPLGPAPSTLPHYPKYGPPSHRGWYFDGRPDVDGRPGPDNSSPGFDTKDSTIR